MKNLTFSNQLIFWYLQNKRDLPWRKLKDPYAIWLSEIIMQQTRIEQGLPYYLRFLAIFPTVFALAEADELQVLKNWQGLGYYSRARNLHSTAKYIAQECNGVFPSTYQELLKLKGVGDYTASAIASICFHEATAVVDGNVYRVLARYFGIRTAINSSQGQKEFKALAQELISTEDPGTHNQALMEFGAIQCKPQNPHCESCPFNSGCMAYSNNTIRQLPVKTKKQKIKKRYFNYLVLNNEKTLLQKRTGNGIWKNLFEFPLIESTKEISLEELIKQEKFKELFTNESRVKPFNHTAIIHKLSHQHLFVYFWIVNSTVSPKEAISWTEVADYPVPILIANFVENFKNDD